MRRFIVAITMVVLITVSYGIGRRNSGSRIRSRQVAYYADPMHPAYRSERPGIAPDCGMELQPVYVGNEGPIKDIAGAPLQPGTVTVDAATQDLVGIRVATAEKSGASRTIRVVGRVYPQDTRVYRINPGVDGFIRETYHDSVGLPVKKGQTLASYYSPEFLSVASGFLAAVQGVPGAAGKDGARTVPFPGAVAKQGVSSVQGYTDRLRNLGMSDTQITRMATNHQLPESVEVVAPSDGFILSRNISPGQHFEHHTEFYRIADLSRVWVVGEVNERDMPLLRPGNAARVVVKNTGRRLTGRVSESLPESENGGGTVKLRMEVDNSESALRPEMLVDVELPVHAPSATTLPLDALIDSGSQARVYVERQAGIFEPRNVEPGAHFGDRIEIRRGIQPGERVVVGATFLVDSESRLREQLPSAMLPPAETRAAGIQPEAVMSSKVIKDPSCGMAVDSVKSEAAGNTLHRNDTTYYFCSKRCKEKFQSDLLSAAGRVRGSD
jgi:Cu(I)/Ag(I) efflux system membrane fusion protein